ncbi:sigma-70 family RNA polymerase sigma factor [Bradyrhizobium sp.]|uniref:sigma-70 family RNA polymerase sigma factor n=1 Tax=Bradyrhizobium sp. TaxID=376 RepID=UPI0026286A5C|nr:sigma-70 family RNA polymerase sigma factor [Bradyrhizobium sp.]
MSGDRGSQTPVLKLVAGGERIDVSTSPPNRDLDWAILMARAQDGDGAAYQRLLQEITPYLRSLAARRHRSADDIEDAVQDILLTIHSIRHTYDPTRPFGPWLATIGERRSIDRLRRRSRHQRRETPLQPEHEAVADVGVDMEGKSNRRELERAISDLPPAQQMAIELLKLKEMSLKDAASASGMSINSLKVNTHRALKNLRKILLGRNEL